MQEDSRNSDLTLTNQQKIESNAAEGYLDITDTEGTVYNIGLNLDITPEQAERRLLLEADFMAQATKDRPELGSQMYLMRLLADPQAREDFIRPLIRTPKDIPLEKFGYLSLARINLFFVNAAMDSFKGRRTTVEDGLRAELDSMKETVTGLHTLLTKYMNSDKQ